MKESQNIEWKESWRDEYLKWICAFANAEGGVLDIGRNDKGVVIGLPNAIRLLEEIPNKVRDILGILVEVNLREEDGKEYLQIVVEPYPYPISYKGEYHLRSGSTKQELKGAALDRFLLRKQGRHWDSVPVPHFKSQDLDPLALKRFRELATRSQRLSEDDLSLDDAKLLAKLHLLEHDYLKRAAVLLFHPDPEVCVTGAYIKIGYFESDSEVRYHDEIHGPLLLQVDKTMEVLLLKYLKAWISYEGLHRVETYPVPRPALREALLNAIIHKDYGSGAPIQIRVYDHKITVGNASVLPENWTVNDLTREHESRPFNPDIAHVFFRSGQIESWGRGIEKILTACAQAGLPEPYYGDTGATLRLTLPFAPDTGTAQEKSDGINDGINDGIKLNATDQAILEQLRQNPQLTIKDLNTMLNKSERAVERSLKKLQDKALLKRVGPRKTGHWEVLK